MSDNRNRRDFLKAMAKGAVYVTPVVLTLAGPVTTAAQTSGHTKGGGFVMNPMADPTPVAPGPWDSNPPPGR